MLVPTIVGVLLLALLLGFDLASSWRHGALASSTGALSIIIVYLMLMGALSDNWRFDLSICLMLSAVPAIGVLWGIGLLFPFAVLVGGVLLTVGFVRCMVQQQFITAAGVAFLCVMGTLVIAIITLVGDIEPNMQTSTALLLACVVLYIIAVRETHDEWRLAVAVVVMLSVFPVGALMWSVGLPTLAILIVGAATFVAGAICLGRQIRLAKKLGQVA